MLVYLPYLSQPSQVFLSLSRVFWSVLFTFLNIALTKRLARDRAAPTESLWQNQKNKTLERFFEVILVLVLILELSLLIYVRIIQLYELLKFNVLDEQVFQVKL